MKDKEVYSDMLIRFELSRSESGQPELYSVAGLRFDMKSGHPGPRRYHLINAEGRRLPESGSSITEVTGLQPSIIPARAHEGRPQTIDFALMDLQRFFNEHQVTHFWAVDEYGFRIAEAVFTANGKQIPWSPEQCRTLIGTDSYGEQHAQPDLSESALPGPFDGMLVQARWLTNTYGTQLPEMVAALPSVAAVAGSL